MQLPEPVRHGPERVRDAHPMRALGLLLALLPIVALADVTQQYRASYVPIPAAQTAEILVDGVVVVPDIRPLEPACQLEPSLPGSACSVLTLTGPSGATRTLTMRARDLVTGQRSGDSNAIMVTLPTPPVAPVMLQADVCPVLP